MTTIKSRIFERGDKNESDVISDYGTGVKGRFKFCKAAGKVLPIEEARRLDYAAEWEKKQVNSMAAHGIMSTDLIEPTKHPESKEYYSSKSRFRAETKARGMVEIGDAYDRGYDPETDPNSERAEQDRHVNERFKEKLIWNFQKARIRMD